MPRSQFPPGSTVLTFPHARPQCDHSSPVTDAQVKLIECWIGSLTERIPMDYIKAPELPKITSQDSSAQRRIETESAMDSGKHISRVSLDPEA